MKPEIHPKYRDVVFHDTSVDEYFIIGSTLSTSQTIDWKDGKTYPYFTVDTSSASHPFYTGAQQVAKAEGRVAKFNQRFNTMSKGKQQT
jgi:large subunit ribosomal protein L31|tara:strand:+ start:3839 stop:4105 length:267 start_codon:yes stop_codon:yes gene_type:complete